MSRVRRLRRRAGHDAAVHERARGFAAERLDGELEPKDAAWLEEHLVGCQACRAVAVQYEADRAALRGLRDRQPEPPRDLWARTAAAIERESPAAARERAGSGRRRRTPALGVLTGVAVIAVVIGATALSGGFLRGPATTADLPIASAPPVAIASTVPQPGPTPIAVGAGQVGWIGTSADGALAYNVTKVDAVCPAERQPDCATVADRNSKPVAMTIRPKSISQSPVRNQAVVVGTDKAGDDAVLVIALPTAEPTTTPAPTPTASATSQATPTPKTPTPSVSPSTAAPSVAPSPTPAATPAATPTATPAATPTTVPSVSPEPTVASTLAIVTGVKIVGESAAYSPDGAWFAFSARPSDDSAGPDIYVWHVGDKLARPVTDDHVSVFGSWVAGRLIGSRPSATEPGVTTAAPESFLIDPATGQQTALTGAAWRPVVDPQGRWAIAWDGTVGLTPDGLTRDPAVGSLVLRPYVTSVGPDLAASTGAVIAAGPLAEYDVRWDETGTWVAIWIADSSVPSIGRLSLMRVDPVSGALEHPHGAPKDVTALPGFSIADGRLAWATPPARAAKAPGCRSSRGHATQSEPSKAGLWRT